MFNSKRIIFLIGLLSVVAVSGALLAGPAFAKGDKVKGKVEFCHYQGYEAAVMGLDENLNEIELEPEEPEMWVMKSTSVSSWLKHHSVNHTPDDILYDFLTDDFDRDPDTGNLITSNDTSVCTDRDVALHAG